MAKFCKKCGAQLADEAVFCPKCGTAQNPVAPQTQDQVPPQAQPQPAPQAQPQPKPQKTGTPLFSAADIGFKKEDFKFNPIKETITGNLSRYSIFALFVTISFFFFSLLNVVRVRGVGRTATLQSAAVELAPVSNVFRTIFMVLFIFSIIWFMFRMFLKRVSWFDHLVLGAGSCLYLFMTIIAMIVVGARAGGMAGLSFAGVLTIILGITAIAAGILPMIFKIIRKK